MHQKSEEKEMLKAITGKIDNISQVDVELLINETNNFTKFLK